MYDPAEYKTLLGTTKPQKSRWRGCWELMRLHKPVMGNTLMFWPCGECLRDFSALSRVMLTANPRFTVWGLTMAAYAHNIQPHELALQTTMFAVGSTLIHSAACVLNDICDIEFDRKVGECPRSDFFMHLGSNANVDAMLV